MNNRTLKFENLAFAGTGGISRNNSNDGFAPAFLEQETGRVELARFENGSPAPVHLIAWLPHEWAATREEDGAIASLHSGIISGFVLQGVFYTREEAAMH